MKLISKLVFVLLLAPLSLSAQPGVRMSADFLPLEVGNRWAYDVFDEAGQKVGNLEFGVQDYQIVGGRSFYLLNGFPFVTDGSMIKLVRYDRQEREYMRMLDNEEGPLFLADGTRVEVLQADSSGLPVKFILHADLVDLTFQRGQGIVEARMHAGKDVQIAKLTSLRTSDRKAVEAAAQGAPALPPPKPADQKPKDRLENVARATEENVALDVQATAVPGGTKFLLTVVNATDKLIPFAFTTGQTYDFVVEDTATGQEIWRWSRRMFFTQVIRQEALRPNKNWTFEVTWNHRDNDLNVVSAGKYRLVGSLVTRPLMASPPIMFEIQ
jgi:hypothetical protein